MRLVADGGGVELGVHGLLSTHGLVGLLLLVVGASGVVDEFRHHTENHAAHVRHELQRFRLALLHQDPVVVETILLGSSFVPCCAHKALALLSVEGYRVPHFEILEVLYLHLT